MTIDTSLKLLKQCCRTNKGVKKNLGLAFNKLNKISVCTRKRAFALKRGCIRQGMIKFILFLFFKNFSTECLRRGSAARFPEGHVCHSAGETSENLLFFWFFYFRIPKVQTHQRKNCKNYVHHHLATPSRMNPRFILFIFLGYV